MCFMCERVKGELAMNSLEKIKDVVLERERKLHVCCPVCGHILMKSAKANDEIKCCKCKEKLAVFLENNRLLIAIDKRCN